MRIYTQYRPENRCQFSRNRRRNGFFRVSVSVAVVMAATESPSTVSSLRLWAFSAAATPVALEAVLSYKNEGLFSVLLLVTTAVVLAVNGAGMVNTYILRDHARGVPSSSRAPAESLHSQMGRPFRGFAKARGAGHQQRGPLYGFGMACL